MMNSPKLVPKPSSTVANEAIGLLAALGNDKTAAAKILKEIKEAQLHNEKAFAEGRDVLLKASKAEKAAKQAKADALATATKSKADGARREARLDSRKNALDEECADRNAALSEREDEFKMQSDDLALRLRNVAMREKELDALQTAVERDRNDAAKALDTANSYRDKWNGKIEELQRVAAG